MVIKVGADELGVVDFILVERVLPSNVAQNLYISPASSPGHRAVKGRGRSARDRRRKGGRAKLVAVRSEMVKDVSWSERAGENGQPCVGMAIGQIDLTLRVGRLYTRRTQQRGSDGKSGDGFVVFLTGRRLERRWAVPDYRSGFVHARNGTISGLAKAKPSFPQPKTPSDLCIPRLGWNNG